MKNMIKEFDPGNLSKFARHYVFGVISDPLRGRELDMFLGFGKDDDFSKVSGALAGMALRARLTNMLTLCVHSDEDMTRDDFSGLIEGLTDPEFRDFATAARISL